jgi:hypothetical protein
MLAVVMKERYERLFKRLRPKYTGKGKGQPIVFDSAQAEKVRRGPG